MKDDLIKNLASAIDIRVVKDLVKTYERLVAKHRAGDAEGALTSAGKFVEHTLRAVEFIKTGSAPAEIKSPAATARALENMTALSDSLRFLIPRVACAMIYDMRSKRGAAHVKEIDPRNIDVALAVSAASWIMAELVRLYHVSAEDAVMREMAALMRAQIPFVELLGGEVVVTQKVPGDIEILLLLANATPEGLNRTELGESAKCSASSVTRGLQKLDNDRLVHKNKAGVVHIAGTGETYLANWLSERGKWVTPAATAK